jgi:hypothetical protein
MRFKNFQMRQRLAGRDKACPGDLSHAWRHAVVVAQIDVQIRQNARRIRF